MKSIKTFFQKLGAFIAGSGLAATGFTLLFNPGKQVGITPTIILLLGITVLGGFIAIWATTLISREDHDNNSSTDGSPFT